MALPPPAGPNAAIGQEAPSPSNSYELELAAAEQEMLRRRPSTRRRMQKLEREKAKLIGAIDSETGQIRADLRMEAEELALDRYLAEHHAQHHAVYRRLKIALGEHAKRRWQAGFSFAFSLAAGLLLILALGLGGWFLMNLMGR